MGKMKMVLDLGFGDRVLLDGDVDEIAAGVEEVLVGVLPYPAQVLTTPSEVARSLRRNGYATVRWRDLSYSGFGREYYYGNLDPYTDDEPERGPEVTVYGFYDDQGW